MRKTLLLATILLSLLAPDVRAAAPSSERVPLTARVTQGVAEPVTSELRLTKVQVSERSPGSEADVAQLPARGSFWWLVGVIVVAGVILAVLV